MLSITKEQLAQLPPVEYDGRIHVVDTISGVRDVVAYLTKCDMVGFDTETRPTFTKGKTHKVALLQLSTDEECFLIRLNKTGMPNVMRDFLESNSPIKIGLSIKDDFHSICKVCDGFNPDGFVELQDYVKGFDISDMSLQKVYGIIFGQRISKAQRLSNWEADELSPAQQRYASIDAWACLKIYRHLLAGNFNPETWCFEDFDLLPDRIAEETGRE
ncbi:MAG: 3'-5' exonuclease domain-containing protein 2 [Muribaculaceae bacterium]|nr:3'-5' exonuclease domain-containing protein 2 [Muribaculaceae bacterium]MDE6094042.1 3'-5' exonuclease domain-containing protein 2 [Muribaculaceae bacterium]MDE6504220.1 3'-5' exonuclease domain-containing protein 2 [Muribaculaceae bacterium]